MIERIPRLGTWSVPGQTQTAGTAITQGIPPWPGPQPSAPLQYAIVNGVPNWWGSGAGSTHLTLFCATSGSTAHTWGILRPLNFTTVASAVAANTSSIVLSANPGTYSTRYQYRIPSNSNVSAVADLTPASTHYYAVQLADGTWFFDLISAWNGGTLTVTTTASVPNPTSSSGVGINAGAAFFLLGSTSTVDPATGFVHPKVLPPVSVTTTLTEGDTGIAVALHPGDPMMIVNANGTAASTLVVASGYYGRGA